MTIVPPLKPKWLDSDLSTYNSFQPSVISDVLVIIIRTGDSKSKSMIIYYMQILLEALNS